MNTKFGAVVRTPIYASVGLTASAGGLSTDAFDCRNESRFKRIVSLGAGIEKSATCMKFGAAPAWVSGQAGGFLVFGEVRREKLRKRVAKDGLEISGRPSGDAAVRLSARKLPDSDAGPLLLAPPIAALS